MKRVFLIVLDSVGIGAAPDAHIFGDAGANTLRSCHNTGLLRLPNLVAMGLGNIVGVDFLPRTESPIASYGRLRESSMGKDTTIGHWELMGLVSPDPLPTYPEGFPTEVLDAFMEKTGRGVLCNRPYSGTEVIKDYGEEHLKTGKLIVYTSADSVFQIAAHEDLIPPEELYRYCAMARDLLRGKHGVGRVIARPFTGEYPFTRTANRRDFSLAPPRPTLMDRLKEAGKDVIAVGKIEDIFAGRGVTRAIHTHGNTHGMEVTLNCAKEAFHGLCFVNLVDFDMVYGHRQNAQGYANALNEFDAWLPGFLDLLGEEDLLLITADHGCDPGDCSTDHTREDIPLLVYGKKAPVQDLGLRQGFFHVAQIVAEALGVAFTAGGN